MRASALALAVVACGPRAAHESPHDEPSPCEAALLPAPAAGPASFDAFLHDYIAAEPAARADVAARFVAAQREFPIVAGDVAVLVYIGSGAEHDVHAIGDFRAKSFYKIDWDPAGVPLAQAVAGGGVWFARLRTRSDARFDYQIVVDGVAAPDALNPHAIESGIAGHASELAMADAARELPRDDVRHGTITTVTEPWAKPAITIYTPPGYSSILHYPVVYTADGSAWRDLIRLPAIIDDLIARRAIDPVIAVMIDAADDRSAWYTWNPDYLAYLDKVVAYVDAHYATDARPARRVHAGSSAGARASLQVSFERSAVFANIAMLSPSLASPPYIFEPYFRGTKRPHVEHVFLSAGIYEGAICEDARMMDRWLRSIGVDARVVYTREGHSFGTWRHIAIDMLEQFFGIEEIHVR